MKEATRQGHMQTVTFPNIRAALLPKLLSGELRVRDANRAVEEVL